MAQQIGTPVGATTADFDGSNSNAKQVGIPTGEFTRTAIISTPATSATYSATVAETFTAADTPTSTQVSHDSQTETVTATDSSTEITLFTVTESSPLVDTSSGTGHFGISVSESVSMADGGSPGPLSFRVHETLSPVEVEDWTLHQNNGVFEVAVLKEAQSSDKGVYNDDLEESVALTDFPDSGTFRLQVTEAAVAADAPSQHTALGTSVAEAAHAADTPSTPTTFAVTVSEAGSMTDDGATPVSRTNVARAVSIIN